MSGEGKVVCVTGASGYIASWVVKLLLQRGYTVKATVRDPNDQKKTEHLRCLDGAKERLHLFKATLLEDGAFDPAVKGCDGVFHIASPALESANDPQADFIDPAVKGTLNVLKSCAKVPSIKRVVVTSSMASIIFNGRPLSPEVVVDETFNSDIAYCESIKFWYAISKTLAEDAAWKFAKEHKLDMVTIHPGFVIGPILQPTLNLTVEVIFKIIDGAEFYPNENYPFVDVRDVANVHIQAFEVPSASGRYCVVERIAHFSEFLKVWHDHYPTLQLPEKWHNVAFPPPITKKNEDMPFPPKYQVSKEKVKSLGIEFTPLEVSAIDTVECLKEKGFLKI